MFPFMRKKRSSYDLTITQDITQEGAEDKPSTNKRSSFKYYGLNNPESKVNPEETKDLVENTPSNEHSPCTSRQKLSDVNESDINSFNEKPTLHANEKDEASEKDEMSEKDEKSEQTPIQSQNGQSPEEESQIFKKCDSIKRKGSEKTDSGDVILRENGADTKTKAKSRPSLLEEVLAETSRLSISSQNRGDVHADDDDDDGEVFTGK